MLIHSQHNDIINNVDKIRIYAPSHGKRVYIIEHLTVTSEESKWVEEQGDEETKAKQCSC
jgi:hypothetical protein